METGENFERQHYLEDHGEQILAPSSGIGRLMYVLKCLSGCLNQFLPSTLTDYKTTPELLSEDEKANVVSLAIFLTPRLLKRVIFVLPNRHPLLHGFNNEFYSPTQVRRLTELHEIYHQTLNLPPKLKIESRELEVTMVMVCNRFWLMHYFVSAMKQERWRVQSVSSMSINPVKYLPPLDVNQPALPRVFDRSASDCISKFLFQIVTN